MGKFSEQVWGASRERGHVRVVAADGHVHIYWGEEHIRTLTLDPTSRYQVADVR